MQKYRLRRHDGKYRSVLDIGAPRFNGDGSLQDTWAAAPTLAIRKRQKAVPHRLQ